jgi:3-methyladenine DNA glycosylase/8-oxoguanine DNA glycosylase
MSDEAARAFLVRLNGIRVWSADIYLLMTLCRPGIRPNGDLALSVGAQQIKQLASRPSIDEIDTLRVLWRPWRAPRHDYCGTTM